MSDKKVPLVAGIGQFKQAEGIDTPLSAAHLGSCLGIIFLAPAHNMSAVVHCLLPLSKSDPEKAKANPYLYVDSGVTEALNTFLKKGINKNELQIYVAGGASINDENGVFEIGKKNFTVFRKLLWKNGILIKGEHVGGSTSRTITWNPDVKKVSVKYGNENIEF